MKIKNSSKLFQKRTLFIAIPVIVVAAAIGGYYLYKAHAPKSSTNIVNYGSATTDQKKAGTSTKSQSITNNQKGSLGGSDTPPAPVSQPGSSQASVQVSITATNQTASTYQIRSIISDVVSTGTCTLTLSKAGYPTFTQTVGVQAEASTSTCKGFDVPLTQLTQGVWQLSLTFSNPSLIGSVNSTITVR